MIAAAGRSFTSFRMTLQNDRRGGEILHFVQDDTGRTSSGRTETGKIMQKVERKKHGERRHGRVVGVVLCALLLAGCVIAAALLTRKAEEKPEPGFLSQYPHKENRTRSREQKQRGRCRNCSICRRRPRKEIPRGQ